MSSTTKICFPLALITLGSVLASAARVTSTTTESISDLRSVLGQSVVVGIPGPTLDTETEQILRQIKPAGIILYLRNIQSARQTKELITKLQILAQETTKGSYLIMLDEEPGGATRLDLFKHVFPLGIPDWQTIERDVSSLSNVGVNVVLSPLADYPFNQNAFIARRLPPLQDEDELMQFNEHFIDILHQHKLAATLKHFPGIGVFVEDPHKELPRANTTGDVLRKSLHIFQSGINSGADVVMSAHGLYESIDPDHTVTTSSSIITGLLKRELNFKGLVVTDDLSDMPSGSHGPASILACNALNAGHNLILFSHYLAKSKKIVDQIYETALKDDGLRSVLESNYRQVTAFKASRGWMHQ